MTWCRANELDKHPLAPATRSGQGPFMELDESNKTVAFFDKTPWQNIRQRNEFPNEIGPRSERYM